MDFFFIKEKRVNLKPVKKLNTQKNKLNKSSLGFKLHKLILLI